MEFPNSYESQHYINSIIFFFSDITFFGNLENARNQMIILFHIKMFPQGGFERILDMSFYKKFAF